MPPLKKYTFKHRFSTTIYPITIRIYEDLEKAWKCLSAYVYEIGDWEYIK